MAKIVKCIVCGKYFERTYRTNKLICSAECRRAREKEYRRRFDEKRKENKIYQKPKAVVEEKKHDCLPTDEVRRLAEEAGLSYGYYVALKHMKGERI